jgi:nitroreductase
MIPMSNDFPDYATLHAVLSQAIRAPSIHNSQPWRWRIGDDSLHLLTDPEVQLPRSDPDGRDRLVSCGIALHHCTVALAAAGWRAHIRRFPERANPGHLAAIELSHAPAADSDIALSAAIPRRRADRRSYCDRPLPAVAIARICARLSEKGVIAREVRSVPILRRIIAQSIHQHTADRAYLAEVGAWNTRYRVQATTCEGGADEGDDHAVVLALGTANDRMLAWLGAGEATSVVLLRATASGLATCPLTEPLEIEETRDAVQREVFSDQASPQMLVRIGWAPRAAEPLPPTSRRAITDIVKYSDGATFG